MAKKITFLLMTLFMLAIASVTAFATESESTASGTGFTNDKSSLSADSSAGSVEKYEEAYGTIFKDTESKSDSDFIMNNITCIDTTGNNPLRRTLTGSVVTTSGSSITGSAVVVLMYIKIDGVYKPLNDVNATTATNMKESSLFLYSTVDLAYVGSNNTNEVRLVIFKKSDADKLVLNKNLQITDLSVTIKKPGSQDKAVVTIDTLKQQLQKQTQ